MAIKSVSGGQITFITKWGMDLYTGSVSTSATNATVNMTKVCTISKDKVYIKGSYLDLSSFVNQGMGYHNGVLYVPISGDENWLERSVVMVFNLDGVITGSTIRPSEAIVFRVTSGTYSALFEMESCDISSGDNRLYFSVQRRKSSTDTNHDGICYFKDYTFVKLTEPAAYKNFVVQYNANGGSGSMASTTVPYGVSTALRKNTFTKDGGKFVGWTAYRTTQNQWYYTNGSSYGWYAEGSQPSGYYKDVYADQTTVAKTTGTDGDVVIMYAQWEENASNDPYHYYLFGWINGGNYGCESDHANLGEYRFVGGKLTATFDQDSYIGVKKVDAASSAVSGWYMTEGWQGFVTSATLYDTNWIGNPDKLYVPGGVPVTFTLDDHDNGTMTVSYVTGAAECSHSYSTHVTVAPTCTTAGVYTYTCTQCGNWYSEDVPATGHLFTNGYCNFCGVSDGSAGQSDTYYLVGWINDADHGCEADWENMGNYKFVNGQLTAKFDSDSYVFVKTEGNGKWLLTDYYTQTPSGIFKEGGTEKMFVPGGVELTFVLTENVDGSVTLTYSTGSTSASVIPTLTLKYPTLAFKDMIRINVFFTAENTQDVMEMGMITYSYPVSRWSVRTAEHVIPCATYDAATGRYYACSQGIHGKYLADTVYLAVYAKLADGSYVYSKLEGSSNGEYRGDITDIAAKELSESVYVAAVYKDAGGTVWTSGVLGYSIGAYCSGQASKGSSIADLAMATAVYGYHAKQYFG